MERFHLPVFLFPMISDRLFPLWKRVFGLSWPVMLEELLRTMMRTTDVIVAGMFSPAAVAAVGLGDLFSMIMTRIGLGIGGGAIALSSQDTGTEAVANRNEAVTQAMLLGFVIGIPILVFGLLFSYTTMDLLGAEDNVIQLGGVYLMVLTFAAPTMHMTFIAARSIQGTGDTTTPMIVRSFANGLNIVGTLVLALGLDPFPELGVAGIALATAIGETTAALLFVVFIFSPWSELSFVSPTDLTITKQLFKISAPRIAQGMYATLIDFPFNAILLALGTEVNAAYHIGRRMYNQIIAPLSRGYGISANVLVGQNLVDDPDTAYFNGLATAALGVITIGSLCTILFVGADLLVLIFTRDPATIQFAVPFARTWAVASVFVVTYTILSSALRGGSETRTPLIATIVGTTVFLLGVSYVGGLYLGFGVTAVYVAVITDYIWRSSLLGFIYKKRQWIDYGTRLMEERGSLSASEN